MNKMFLTANMEKVIWFVLVPGLVLLLLFAFFIFFYNVYHKDRYPTKTSYRVNNWCYTLAIVFGSVLFGLCLGFSGAVYQNFQILRGNMTTPAAAYFLFFMPVLLFFFLLFFIRKLWLNLKLKDLVKKEGRGGRYEENEKYGF